MTFPQPRAHASLDVDHPKLSRILGFCEHDVDSRGVPIRCQSECFPDQVYRVRETPLDSNGNPTGAANAASSTVINDGQITADRGNVTLAGLVVNQGGQITATTSVSANGSIYLVAGDTSSLNDQNFYNGASTTAGFGTMLYFDSVRSPRGSSLINV